MTPSMLTANQITTRQLLTGELNWPTKPYLQLEREIRGRTEHCVLTEGSWIVNRGTLDDMLIGTAEIISIHEYLSMEALLADGWYAT